MSNQLRVCVCVSVCAQYAVKMVSLQSPKWWNDEESDIFIHQLACVSIVLCYVLKC